MHKKYLKIVQFITFKFDYNKMVILNLRKLYMTWG